RGEEREKGNSTTSMSGDRHPGQAPQLSGTKLSQKSKPNVTLGDRGRQQGNVTAGHSTEQGAMSDSQAGSPGPKEEQRSEEHDRAALRADMERMLSPVPPATNGTRRRR